VSQQNWQGLKKTVVIADFFHRVFRQFFFFFSQYSSEKWRQRVSTTTMKAIQNVKFSCKNIGRTRKMAT
jgi:hypothetical protein